jgi:hypothetical protein
MRKRRSRIVPAVVFSTVLAAGTSVIPACDEDNPMLGIPFDVAAMIRDLSVRDLAVPPVGLDVAALDFATPKG